MAIQRKIWEFSDKEKGTFIGALVAFSIDPYALIFVLLSSLIYVIYKAGYGLVSGS
ncbi:MAG TPA: hypothetical protein VF681_14145 [Abditibacteriaceae bacterium]